MLSQLSIKDVMEFDTKLITKACTRFQIYATLIYVSLLPALKHVSIYDSVLTITNFEYVLSQVRSSFNVLLRCKCDVRLNSPGRRPKMQESKVDG